MGTTALWFGAHELVVGEVTSFQDSSPCPLALWARRPFSHPPSLFPTKAAVFLLGWMGAHGCFRNHGNAPRAVESMQPRAECAGQKPVVLGPGPGAWTPLTHGPACRRWVCPASEAGDALGDLRELLTDLPREV